MLGGTTVYVAMVSADDKLAQISPQLKNHTEIQEACADLQGAWLEFPVTSP